MAWHNYDDVLNQIRAAGLLVDRLDVGTEKPRRCRVDGEGREEKGWYWLGEFNADGEMLISGSYGIWRGDDNGATKVEVWIAGRKLSLTKQQIDMQKKQFAAAKRKAKAQREESAAKAAVIAEKAWRSGSETGESDYLNRKGVAAHGTRYSPSGSLMIPIQDTAGRIQGLQVIRSAEARKKRNIAKQYWPPGVQTSHHFHLIGSPVWVLLIGEGYATCASVHEATGLPVAVAFDAHNLSKVGDVMRRRYPGIKLVFLADDDRFGKCTEKDCRHRIDTSEHPALCPNCGKPHKIKNTGIEAASAAAASYGGTFVAPMFQDNAARAAHYAKTGEKLGDFNDLHAAEGLHSVRIQIETVITAKGWKPPTRAGSNRASGGQGEIVPITSPLDLLDRISLVKAQKGVVFDHDDHELMSLDDVKHLCVTDDVYKAWRTSPERKIVRIDNVGFDPTEADEQITCNLWGGWPNKPAPGDCRHLLALLYHLCSGDDNHAQLYDWVLKWLAFPLQNPGAKMKTALVIHGGQGTGKSEFFETVMNIYGRYGQVIDQAAVEDRFNDDWASAKLFVIADEVIARSDLYHVKNKLKAFITGDTIRINIKNLSAHTEKNHVNIVFLSNETMPVVVEEDDRRHCVIWTPAPRDEAFYAAVRAEKRNGGIAALHDYLLNLDLQGFTAGTKPPMTDAKSKLINLSLDSPSQFYYALINGDIEAFQLDATQPIPVGASSDLFELYKLWCRQNNLRDLNQPRFGAALNRKHNVKSERKRWRNITGRNQDNPRAVTYIDANSQPPPDTDERLWLGAQVNAFRDGIDRYKEAIK